MGNQKGTMKVQILPTFRRRPGKHTTTNTHAHLEKETGTSNSEATERPAQVSLRGPNAISRHSHN